MTWTPKSGNVLHIGREASVQFGEPIFFRVIRVHAEWITYDGWIWLDGYELNPATLEATARRSIFVQIAGLRTVRFNAEPRRPTVRSLPTRQG